jgi:hypothetical protein
LLFTVYSFNGNAVILLRLLCSFVDKDKTIQHHILEDSNLHSYCCGNPLAHIMILLLFSVIRNNVLCVLGGG